MNTTIVPCSRWTGTGGGPLSGECSPVQSESPTPCEHAGHLSTSKRERPPFRPPFCPSRARPSRACAYNSRSARDDATAASRWTSRTVSPATSPGCASSSPRPSTTNAERASPSPGTPYAEAPEAPASPPSSIAPRCPSTGQRAKPNDSTDDAGRSSPTPAVKVVHRGCTRRPCGGYNPP